MGSMSGVEAASMPPLPEWLRMLWVAALLETAHYTSARLADARPGAVVACRAHDDGDRHDLDVSVGSDAASRAGKVSSVAMTSRRTLESSQ